MILLKTIAVCFAVIFVLVLIVAISEIICDLGDNFITSLKTFRKK